MRVLVTGGGGFLGGAIVRRLLARGDEVRSFARGGYPELTALGVAVIQGDLGDLEAVRRAASGTELVFHVAAKAGVWGSEACYFQPNVVGTRNVIAACRAEGVPRLVHTSSPSVVFGGEDLERADESVPYPARYLAPYPRTKAIAEREVLAANGAALVGEAGGALATVALRPHLIWGPGDNHLVPRIVERGRRGQLRRIGDKNPLVDSTYIDNAASAHIAAAERLAPGAPCAGRAYFIANDEPTPIWNLIDRILAAADLPPVTRTVPRPLAYAAACTLEATYKLLGIQSEPRLTRFLVKELTTAHHFDLTAARRDLGYAPEVSVATGLQHLRSWLT